MLSDGASGGPPSFHSRPASPFKDIVRFFIPSFAEIASVPLSSPICSVLNKWRKETGGQLEPSARSRSQTGNWVSRNFMRTRTTGEAKEDSVERNRQGSERERGNWESQESRAGRVGCRSREWGGGRRGQIEHRSQGHVKDGSTTPAHSTREHARCPTGLLGEKLARVNAQEEESKKVEGCGREEKQ